MPESTSPSRAFGLAERGEPALTPQGIEAILADFRAWLTDLAAGRMSESEPTAAPAEALDVQALVGQFTALRHEVNLQTKAARAQQEQAAETLRQLSDAVEAFQAQPDDEPADDPALRPLLTGLVEAADALMLAQPEVERLAQAGRAALTDVEPSVAPREDLRTLWARWFGGHRQDAAGRTQQQSAETTKRVQYLFDSVLAGYRMSLQRLQRTLQQHGLAEIPCLGQPFDPERMEALEAVADSGRPDGEVLAVVRAGYERKGKVFRCALVRVATSGSKVGCG
jgi:molecular chaperone GrpE